MAMSMPAGNTSLREVVLAIVLNFAAGTLYGWSALIPALRAAFEANAEMAGMIFSLAILSFTTAVYAAPRLPLAVRGISGLVIYGLLASVMLAVAANATSLAWFTLAFSFGFGATSGAIYILALEISGYSPAPRIATPVTIAAFGLGGVLIGPSMRLLTESGWGLRALYLPVCLLLAVSLLALVLGRTRTSVSAVSSVARDSADGDGERTGFGWLASIPLWFALCFGSMAGLMTLGLATSIIEAAGATAWFSAAVLSGIALGNTSGRLGTAALILAVKPTTSILLALGLVTLGILVAGTSGRPGATATGLIAIALGYGLLASLVPLLTREMFGARRFGLIYSVVFTGWGLAGLSAPWIAGRLFDSWQSYTPAFVFAFVATVLALIASVTLATINRGRTLNP